VCGGDCPPDQFCETGPNGCDCAPLPCDQSDPSTCGGDCPNAGEICTADPAGGPCFCEPPPCDQSDPLTCGGTCPNAGDVCTPDPAGGPCFCEPPPCDESDPATCGGTCLNAGEVCTIDLVSGSCFCESPPVACDQSDPAVCGGECPDANDICTIDPLGGPCFCERPPVGEPCAQCGPGPHFIDNCGPFPPVGTDLVSNNGAVVGIDLDLDCVKDMNAVLRPCPAPDDLLDVKKTLGPIDDSVNFPGTSPVDGHPTGPVLDVLDTEIRAMCLTNGVVTMAAGTAGPSALPLQPSLGTVAEDLTTPDPAWGDSFFGVYFEVSGIPGGPVYNQVPLQIQGRIDCLPPAANYYHPVGICLSLTTSGFCDGGINAGNPCINDLDCPGDVCGGTTLVANLVSANHSVNQPVCQEDPFGVCGGDCPPGEICQTGPAGCDCVPVACEQSDPLTCGGDCPPGEICTPGAVGSPCFCDPIPVTCEQSDPLTCGGTCQDPNDVCYVDPSGGPCFCDKPGLDCVLSDPLTCGGACPDANDVCTADPAGGPCFCETPPVACDVSDPLTCGGVCPTPSDVCTVDPAGGPCFCESPPVLCEQDSFPVCGGDCPTGSHCEPAAGDAAVLPSPDLPPESDPPDPECVQILSMYEGQDVHAQFPDGIDFSDPRHYCFRNVQRTVDPGTGDETETFDSIMEGTADLGGGPVPVTLTGPVTTVVRGKGGATTGSWDTEILSMSLSGDVGGVSIQIRESPSLPSPGQTSVTDLGGGQWQIDSFFDVFVELSVNSGPFQPQTNPGGRMALRRTPPPVVLPSPGLPPEGDPPDPRCEQVLSMYVGNSVHALFPGGIDFSDPNHRCFQNVVVTTDPGTGDETETFDSIMEGTVDMGGGPVPVTLTGPVTTVVRGKGGATTGSWDTEILSMSLSGDVGGVSIEIRESPNLPSPGHTSVVDLGGGQWQIDSFFDVFTELSVNGGGFQPQTNPGGRMELVPTPQDECECVPDPVSCEQSDPATCGGFCTGTNELCGIGPAGLCECIPDTYVGGAVPDGGIVPGIPLTLQRSASEAVGDITLSWGASCSPSDDDYEIYEGSVPAFYSHTARFCTTGGATTITFTPIAGFAYYLVVPRNPLREGSYGADSALAERPQGGSACLPQLIGACP